MREVVKIGQKKSSLPFVSETSFFYLFKHQFLILNSEQPKKQVGADAWNPEAGILGLHMRKDNLQKIEQILINEKYC